MTSLSLGHLTYEKLKGLVSLTTLNLEKSNIKMLEPKFLRAVPNLKHLQMAHCTGLDKIPVETLIGKIEFEDYDVLLRSFLPLTQSLTFGYLSK